jgi:uncharacterized membrane protein
MNGQAPPPGEQLPLDSAKQAEAHLIGVAMLAVMLTLFGLPAACYGGCASQSFGLMAALLVVVYAALVSTIVYWFRYRAKHPAARVSGLSVLMAIVALIAVGPLLVAIYVVTQL